MIGWCVERTLRNSQARRSNAGRADGDAPDNGFILVIVISVLLVVSLMALGFSRAVQAYLRETAVQTQMARAEFFADSGVNLAVLDLAAAREAGTPARFARDGSPISCQLYDGATLSVAVRDTSGLVDLNLASAKLLTTLLTGLGAPLAVAQRHASRIIDFRDADSVREPDGAERDDYLAAGRTLGPKNAPFEAFEELYQILEADPALITAMKAYVTSHFGNTGLDPELVSPKLAVILARGFSVMTETGRATGNWQSDTEITKSSAPSGAVIVVAVQMPGGTIFVREAILDLGHSHNGVPAIKYWARGAIDEELKASLSAGRMPPC